MSKKKDIDQERMHELYLAGKQAKEIASELGTTAAYIHQRIQCLRKKDPHMWPRRNGHGSYGLPQELTSPPAAKPPLEATYKREFTTTPVNGDVITRQMMPEECEKYKTLPTPTNSLGNPIKQPISIPERSNI